MAKCPECSKEFSENTVGGLCPACLLQRGLESQAGVTSGPEAETSADPGSERDASRTMSPEQLMFLLPQFDQIELIGRGGMGVVYKARQKNLDRPVALKVLLPEVAGSPGFAERFAREARAMARLSHPNVVAVYDFGIADNAGVELCYFTMEFVDGSNLRGLLKQLSSAQALAIIPQICEALQYAHDIGIVHRDIKPENILVDKKGRVKIADFGLAKLLQQAKTPTDYTLTQSQVVMGTPSYMAPEQLEHPTEVDHRADLYSLGVVFYEMLTGQLPKGRFALPSQKVQIDVRFDEIVLKALEHDRELRYQHASEVQTSVESVRSSMQPLPTPEVHPGSAPDLTPVIHYAAPSTSTTRLSRVAILASLFLIAGLFAMGLDGVMIVAHKTQGNPISRQDWTVFIAVLIVPLIAGIATTLLGVIAVGHIRAAPEKLYGLRLALFDALLCPLILLDFLFAGLVEVVLASLLGQGRGGVSVTLAPLFFLLPLTAMLLVDPLIYWWVWKKLRVEKLPPNRHHAIPGPAAARTVEQVRSHHSRMAVTGAVFSAIALAVGFALVILASGYRATPTNPDFFASPIGIVGITLGIAFGSAGLLMGWLAAIKILQSEGRLHGLHSALFAATLLPAIALAIIVGIIAGVGTVTFVATTLPGTHVNPMFPTMVTGWVTLALTAFLIWRFARKHERKYSPSISAMTEHVSPNRSPTAPVPMARQTPAR